MTRYGAIGEVLIDQGWPILAIQGCSLAWKNFNLERLNLGYQLTNIVINLSIVVVD